MVYRSGFVLAPLIVGNPQANREWTRTTVRDSGPSTRSGLPPFRRVWESVDPAKPRAADLSSGRARLLAPSTRGEYQYRCNLERFPHLLPPRDGLSSLGEMVTVSKSATPIFHMTRSFRIQRCPGAASSTRC